MPGCYVIHLLTDQHEVSDETLERLEAEVASRGLGEVDAVMKAGGLEVVVWVTVTAESEALAGRQVRPGLEGLIDEFGLSALASLEWVEDSEDEDDEDDEEGEKDPGADDEFDDLGDDLDEDDAGEDPGSEDPADDDEGDA